MSVSKKRAAPKPPMPDLTPQNKENVMAAKKENGKEDVKKKLSGDKMSLKVVFQDQTTAEVQVPSDTPIIDLRTQLCSKYKLNVGGHQLELLDENGRSINFTNSCTIASTSAKAVHLKPKAKKEPAKVAPPKVVEQTVRLTVKMSRSHQQVLRVRPTVPLTKLMPQIMEKTGLGQEDHKHLELRHPEQITMALDVTRSLDDYKIREIFVADKRVHIESPDPEHEETASPITSPEKTPGKVSRGGTEKRSKKIKKFFRLSKKQKSSSSSEEPTSPSSPVTTPPAIPESKHEERANSNDNNSTEREKASKKKRHAPPIKHPDQQQPNEPLHGQVTEKMDVTPTETIQKTEAPVPVESEVPHEEEVKKIPSSPPARPTAPPRAKPRPVAAARSGKKKAPPPPQHISEPPPPAEPSSPKDRSSRPEKPPRRQSIERQKDHPDSPEETEYREKKTSIESEHGAIEFEVPIGRAAQKSPEVEEKVQEYMEVHTEDVDGYQEEDGGRESPEFPEEVQPSPEPKSMEVVEDDANSMQDSETYSEQEPAPETSPDQEPAVELYTLSKPVLVSPPAPEPMPAPEDETPKVEPLDEEKKMNEERADQRTPDIPIPDLPPPVADIPPPLEEPAQEAAARAITPPPSPEPEEEFEIIPAPGEELPHPDSEDTKYHELPPPVVPTETPLDIPTETRPESPPLPEPAPEEIADMLAYHDIGYKPVEPVLTQDDNLNVPEPEMPSEPEVNPPEPSVLDDGDNLFTTPSDFDMYDAKKDDYAAMEAKALEMIKQFALSENAAEEDAMDDSYPPPPEDMENLSSLSHSGQGNVQEEQGEKTDAEAMQEIERLKEQINLMRQKKAKKEAEEEAARKNPYTIVQEAKPGAELGQGQVKGAKTFTFVPNPKAQQRHHEDYEAAPEMVINFSQSGEIKGVGISAEPELRHEVKESTSEKPSSPTTTEKQQSPARSVSPKSPEIVTIEPVITPAPVEVEKPPLSPPKPMPPQKPAELGPKPVQNVPVVKPKGPGGYVSSAMMRQPAAKAAPSETYTPGLYGNEEPSRKSALPNYYRRFLKMNVDSTPGKTEESSAPSKPVVTEKPSSKPTPEKIVPNGQVSAPKSPPPIAEKPKSPLAEAVNTLLNSPQIENLPTPPEEYPADTDNKPEEPNFDDAPLPPPPEEFLTPTTKKEEMELPLPPANEYGSQPVISSPKKATSPGYSPFSTNFVGISAAKPFGAAGGTKFRPMAANFKGAKKDKPSSP